MGRKQVVASLIPAHPWLGLSLAFASHFLFDALPHWDYPIRSSSIKPEVAARMKYDGALLPICSQSVEMQLLALSWQSLSSTRKRR
jgi:hypothetical protein